MKFALGLFRLLNYYGLALQVVFDLLRRQIFVLPSLALVPCGRGLISLHTVQLLCVFLFYFLWFDYVWVLKLGEAIKFLFVFLCPKRVRLFLVDVLAAALVQGLRRWPGDLTLATIILQMAGVPPILIIYDLLMLLDILIASFTILVVILILLIFGRRRLLQILIVKDL